MDAENTQRQLDELQALRAMYPEDECCFILQPAEQQALAAATAALEAAADGKLPQDVYLPNLSGTIMLPDFLLAGSPVSLRFQLPAAYPAEAPAQVTLMCSAPRSLHEQLSMAMNTAAQEALGSESLLLLLDKLQELVMDANSSLQAEQQQEQQQQEAETNGLDQDAASTGHICSICLLRVSIWFHHIKNTEKRKNLVGWARQLNVGGFSKPGFPGVVIAEGLIADTREYVARIRALQWQAMQVRGEEIVKCADCAAWRTDSGDSGDRKQSVEGKGTGTTKVSRGFQGRFEELPESGMSELGQLCKAAGMEELFLATLKLTR